MNSYCLHLQHFYRIAWHCITSLALAVYLLLVNIPASIAAAEMHDIRSAV